MYIKLTVLFIVSFQLSLGSPQLFLIAVKNYRFHVRINYDYIKFSVRVDFACFFTLCFDVSVKRIQNANPHQPGSISR